MKEGSFRLDLYRRICADRISTPSLRERLDALPEERRTLVLHIAEKVAGAAEADELADEVEAWIDANVRPDYAWPGNVRELEQCVRNRLVHHSCRPLDLTVPPRATSGATRATHDAEHAAFLRALREGRVTVAQLLAYYANLVQAQTGSVRETAKRLGIDRRTVKQYVDEAQLAPPVAPLVEDETDEEKP
jgi:DNA-binding NtrC family response regulator